MPRWLDTAVGNWQIGALQIAQSGQPFSVHSQRLTVPVSGNPNVGGYAHFASTAPSIGKVQRRGDGVYFFTPGEAALVIFPHAFENLPPLRPPFPLPPPSLTHPPPS